MNLKSLFVSLLLVIPTIIFAAPAAEPCRFELSASAQKFWGAQYAVFIARTKHALRSEDIVDARVALEWASAAAQYACRPSEEYLALDRKITALEINEKMVRVAKLIARQKPAEAHGLLREIASDAQEYKLNVPEGFTVLLKTTTDVLIRDKFEAFDKAFIEHRISPEEYIAGEKRACQVDFLALGFTEPERCKKYK